MKDYISTKKGATSEPYNDKVTGGVCLTLYPKQQLFPDANNYDHRPQRERTNDLQWSPI